MSNVEDHPVQILTFNKAKKNFELNSNELVAILNSPDVRDANIAVVSIAGAFRKGKSFMLSFFLRYLNETYVHAKEDWLGSPNTKLSGFSWRGGSERHTTGIWIWSKVFTKTLPNGEKIGVMLMNTQGTFDSNSTMHHNVTIFTLSTMLSSIQIYNLFNNIQEDDLQNLQLFTEYGKLALAETDEKAFQTLLFLVRDWNFPYESPYGFVGGRQLLEKKLKVTEDQEQELTDLRNHLKSCYDKLDCFLMPYPGQIATRSRDFDGQLNHIDTIFIDMLREFVPALLAPQNIVTKKIGGAKLNGRTLLTYIESYWGLFSKGGMPNAQTILGATSKANNLTAKEEATDFYQSEMNSATGSDKEILEFIQMVELHNTVARKAIELFRSKAVMGEEKMKAEYQKKLSDSLQSNLMLYLGQNEAKKSKSLSETIDNLSTQIDSYRTTNTEQVELLQGLKAQLEQYRRSSDEEKARLQREIEALRTKLANQPKGGICNIL